MANKTTLTAGLVKMPPNDTETEAKILGSILLNPNSLVTIINLFRPEIFYMDNHQRVAGVILNLHNAGKKIDEATVINGLKKEGFYEEVGGFYFITELLDKYSRIEHLNDHIKIIYEKFLLREQIRFFTEKIGQCYNQDDPFDIIVNTSKFMDELQRGVMVNSEIHVSELATIATLERQDRKPKENLGVRTGSVELDKSTGGWQYGQLIIVAGRPAMGKTTFAMFLVKALGFNKVPVAVFSLEMSAGQLYTKLQSSVSEIDSKKIRYNNLSEHESVLLDQTDGQISNCPIFIDDTPALNIDAFRAKATIMKFKYGIQAIIIDYLQLMKGSKGNFNKEAEVSEISGKLKQVAKELKIPVIALAQLSREVEKRGGDKIPQLSDLRDSGSIEQDADVIMFLHRPSYYESDKPVYYRNYNLELQPKNLLSVIIAKQREGETGAIPLQMKLNIMQITDHPAITGEGTFESMPVQTDIFKSQNLKPFKNDGYDEDEEPF